MGWPLLIFLPFRYASYTPGWLPNRVVFERAWSETKTPMVYINLPYDIGNSLIYLDTCPITPSGKISLPIISRLCRALASKSS